MQVFYTGEAKKQLSKLAKSDAKSARIIFDHIKKLPDTYSHDPFLKGTHFQGLRRNRTGRYRIIYRVIEQEKEIRIITIAHRKSVYE